MQACKFTITTSVDGMENTVSHVGSIDICEEKVALTYEEGNSQVSITLQRGAAQIDRKGDYSLCLRLEEGKTLESTLGIGGAEGCVLITTHRVKYSLDGNIFKLSLRYDLIFSEEESQKMKLNLKGIIRNR